MPLRPLPRAWRLATRRSRPAKRARADVAGPLPMRGAMWRAGASAGERAFVSPPQVWSGAGRVSEIAGHKVYGASSCVKHERPEVGSNVIEPAVEVEECACSAQYMSQRKGHGAYDAVPTAIPADVEGGSVGARASATTGGRWAERGRRAARGRAPRRPCVAALG
eukprot:569755-Pleurochrysis_carterae.AAC.4